MISAKFVTCELCQNYYADPRQISCSHSFCYDCLLGRFDEQSLTLICPKCNKLHQFSSLEQFERRCMLDGLLASMVTQYKKNQSRLPPGFPSRPSSITSVSTLNQSSSERSTPSQRSTSTVPQAKPSSTVTAKCQLCNNRRELTVCEHCDNVICIECAEEHQRCINQDVKHQWEICTIKFEDICEQSMQFDQNEEKVDAEARQLQTYIRQLSDHWVQTAGNYKNTYMNMIENYRQTYKPFVLHEQVVDEYESIDKRLEDFLKSNNITVDRIDDFLFEIEHLEGRLDNLNQSLDTNSIQFPELTRTGPIDVSSLFGTLNLTDFNRNSSPILNGHAHLPNSSENDPFDPSIKSDSINNLPRRKLLWQIEYFSVPYYLRIHDNHLYICDKYGALAIYRLYLSSKPMLLEEIRLFKDTSTSTTNDENQTFIDSFAICKFWIVVFKRKKNELHGTIYLFTHNGKLLPNGKITHNYPSRELTVDTERNLLWSLDQKQFALFYYDLPEKNAKHPDEYFRYRQSHVQFTKPFAPIHISVNQNGIAVLEKYRQAVHIYDKNTRAKIDEHVNCDYHSTHVCWDMALFSDNSLLIKLDQSNTLKSEPSKHIYLHLDSSHEHRILGRIEELDAYGMMISPNDEILIGIRVNAKGIIKCYV